MTAKAMTIDEVAFYETWEKRLKGHARGLDFYSEDGHDMFYKCVRADVEILETADLCALAKHHGASEIAISTRGAEWALTDAYMKAHRPFRMNATRIAEIEKLCTKLEHYTEHDIEQAKVEYQYRGPQLVALIRTFLREREGLL